MRAIDLTAVVRSQLTTEAANSGGPVMDYSASPMVLRRRLRTELLAAREKKGLTQQNVAEAMDWSLSKMNRIENAKTGISTNDLRALLELYGVADREQVDRLVALARGARKETWWRSYSDVAPQGLLQLMDYESAASVINQFEMTFVPGILQTEAYASAVLQLFYNEKSDERVARLVELRTRRKQLLTTENAPKFRFILDESVIRRQVGNDFLMQRQLQYLVSIAARPNVQIQVATFAAGLHPGMMTGSFEVVQFKDAPSENIVFAEGAQNFLIEDSVEAGKYLETFGQITHAAVSPEESLTLVETAASRAG